MEKPVKVVFWGRGYGFEIEMVVEYRYLHYWWRPGISLGTYELVKTSCVSFTR